MAKIKTNPLLAGFSGRIKDLVFVTQPNGDVIVRSRPERKAKRTRAEKAQNERLTAASAYAKAAAADPAKRAFYESLPRSTHIGPYHLAVRDFHRAPVVEEVDVSAYTGKARQSIRITATDDCGVVEVAVQILDMDEAVVEEGLATLQEGGLWQYGTSQNVAAGQTVSVRATAKDRPGNTGEKSAMAYAK